MTEWHSDSQYFKSRHYISDFMNWLVRKNCPRHVMCKTCTTANTTHHVSCFHSEPTATNIKNTASPANHFWNVHRQYDGSVVSAVVLQQKGSGFETWLGQSSLPCWAPLSCGVCRFSPGTPAPSHSPKLREWSIILKGNVTGCLSLCFTPFD